MELVVIGTTEFLPGFALAGVQKTVLATQQTLMETIKQHRDAGIIILDAALTSELSPHDRDELDTSVAPIIITLAKDTNQEARLKRAIISTLGVDLLK